MNKPYVITRAAAADLNEISCHTNEQWGAAQRLAYIQQLEGAALALAKGEGMFKDLSAIHPRLRMARCGRHYIFCLRRPNAPAVILAIFHERMDITARLRSRLA